MRILQKCVQENKEDLSDLERELYLNLARKCIQSERHITVSQSESNLRLGTLQPPGGPIQPIALHRLEFTEISEIESIFKNYKKWKNNNLMEPIGVTYLTNQNALFLLVNWSQSYSPISESSLPGAETNIKIRVIIQIAKAVKHVMKNFEIFPENLYIDENGSPKILFTAKSQQTSEPIGKMDSGKIVWNIGLLMSCVFGDSVSLPFGDYQQVEALITDYLECDPKNQVKYTYLTNEMQRITNEYGKVATKQMSKWRRFKKSRKIFSIKFRESALI